MTDQPQAEVNPLEEETTPQVEQKPEPTPQAPAKDVIPGEEDIEERVSGFNKEFVPLLAKYELGIGANALITPDGRVGASPTVLSARKKKEEAVVTPTPPAPAEPAQEKKIINTDA